MKRSLSLCAMLVIGVVGFAAAKTRPAVTVNIPFEFIVGNQKLPAGSYRVEGLLQSQPGADSIEILALRNTTRQIYRTVVADVGPELFAKSGAELGFRRYAGQTYLTSVRCVGKLLSLRPSTSELAIREKSSESEAVLLAVESSNGL